MPQDPDSLIPGRTAEQNEATRKGIPSTPEVTCSLGCEVCRVKSTENLRKVAISEEYERPLFRWLRQVEDHDGNLIAYDPSVSLPEGIGAYMDTPHYLLQVCVPYPTTRRPSILEAVPSLDYIEPLLREFMHHHNPLVDPVRYDKFDTDKLFVEPTRENRRPRFVPINVVLPLPVALVKDTEYDIIGEMLPEIKEAAGGLYRVAQLTMTPQLWAHGE